MALTYRAKVKFSIERFLRFLKVFRHNRRGALGIVILVIFGTLAVAAPIITPYHPTLTELLAGPLAAPSWLRYVPGAESLSENLHVSTDPGFETPDSLQQWHFTFSSTPEDFNVQYVSSFGNPKGSGPGSIAVTFKRDAIGTTHGNTRVTLTKDFYYPYKGPPERFAGDITLTVEGTGKVEEIGKTSLDVPIVISVFIQQVGGERWNLWPAPYPDNPRGTTSARAPVVVDVVQGDPSGQFTETVDAGTDKGVPVVTWTEISKYNIASYNVTLTDGDMVMVIKGQLQDPGRKGQIELEVVHAATIETVPSTWITAKASPESPISIMSSLSRALKRKMFRNPDDPRSPLRTVFDEETLPTTFTYGVEIIFQDFKNPDEKVEATIYIDDLNLRLLGSSFGLLGTDQYGRDIFTQLVYGTQLSLYLGLLSSIISVVLGLAVGLFSGYLGGVADEIMMRLTDMLLVLPTLPLLIVLVAVLGPRLNNLVLLIGLLGWMGFARLVRSQVLSLKERPFIEAAKAVGSGKIHIIITHILPNVMSLVYITLATFVPGAIVAEAALSWLGFYDPTVMSWGRMLHDVQAEAQAVGNWWWVIPPGLSIALIAVSFILIGYALDEILNPRLRLRR